MIAGNTVRYVGLVGAHNGGDSGWDDEVVRGSLSAAADGSSLRFAAFLVRSSDSETLATLTAGPEPRGNPYLAKSAELLAQGKMPKAEELRNGMVSSTCLFRTLSLHSPSSPDFSAGLAQHPSLRRAQAPTRSCSSRRRSYLEMTR